MNNIDKILELSDEPALLTERFSKLVPLRRKYQNASIREVPGWKLRKSDSCAHFKLGSSKPFTVKNRFEIYKHPRYPSDPKLPKIVTIPTKVKRTKLFFLKFTLRIKELELILKNKVSQSHLKNQILLSKAMRQKRDSRHSHEHDQGVSGEDGMLCLVLFVKKFIDMYLMNNRNKKAKLQEDFIQGLKKFSLNEKKPIERSHGNLGHYQDTFGRNHEKLDEKESSNLHRGNANSLEEYKYTNQDLRYTPESERSKLDIYLSKDQYIDEINSPDRINLTGNQQISEEQKEYFYQTYAKKDSNSSDEMKCAERVNHFSTHTRAQSYENRREESLRQKILRNNSKKYSTGLNFHKSGDYSDTKNPIIPSLSQLEINKDNTEITYNTTQRVRPSISDRDEIRVEISNGELGQDKNKTIDTQPRGTDHYKRQHSIADSSEKLEVPLIKIDKSGNSMDIPKSETSNRKPIKTPSVQLGENLSRNSESSIEDRLIPPVFPPADYSNIQPFTDTYSPRGFEQFNDSKNAIEKSVDNHEEIIPEIPISYDSIKPEIIVSNDTKTGKLEPSHDIQEEAKSMIKNTKINSIAKLPNDNASTSIEKSKNQRKSFRKKDNMAGKITEKKVIIKKASQNIKAAQKKRISKGKSQGTKTKQNLEKSKNAETENSQRKEEVLAPSEHLSPEYDIANDIVPDFNLDIQDPQNIQGLEIEENIIDKMLHKTNLEVISNEEDKESSNKPNTDKSKKHKIEFPDDESIQRSRKGTDDLSSIINKKLAARKHKKSSIEDKIEIENSEESSYEYPELPQKEQQFPSLTEKLNPVTSQEIHTENTEKHKTLQSAGSNRTKLLQKTRKKEDSPERDEDSSFESSDLSEVEEIIPSYAQERFDQIMSSLSNELKNIINNETELPEVIPEVESSKPNTQNNSACNEIVDVNAQLSELFQAKTMNLQKFIFTPQINYKVPTRHEIPLDGIYDEEILNYYIDKEMLERMMLKKKFKEIGKFLPNHEHFLSAQEGVLFVKSEHKLHPDEARKKEKLSFAKMLKRENIMRQRVKDPIVKIGGKPILSFSNISKKYIEKNRHKKQMSQRVEEINLKLDFDERVYWRLRGSQRSRKWTSIENEKKELLSVKPRKV